MKAVIIEGFAGARTEVSTSVHYEGIVSIDINFGNHGDGCALAHYTAYQARKLAAALIQAAEGIENGKGYTGRRRSE
ncbi:hypothetical protein FDI67_gp02 [Escherichia phage phiKP26]|uniref:Uncharacterized protein n=3 Tax=Rogunavirus TaxID=1920866 RepID=A0A0P0I875_9CAUD|nr:hypothetical protein FDI67_gp02 [Escherichia phage phiKP26]YP_009615895.1 hypothetical protein FDI75_gp60 [Escherichia phage C119]YP_009784117.1 hypothetical protein HOQ90_gp32 [Enterobacteria phage phiJLA23]AGC35362.1 hypothetical protein JLA_32 [Enterobacteria phage phiJLA23]AGH25144.1 hypothetical protein kp_2 [Escherichia phage phiKP26]ALJ98940.1 hypothetical protein C119_60 [Escherichia phage C119]